MIAVLGSAIITGRPFAVYRDGAAAHDYVYVDDVVDAFMRAGCAPIETTGTYNNPARPGSSVTDAPGWDQRQPEDRGTTGDDPPAWRWTRRCWCGWLEA